MSSAPAVMDLIEMLQRQPGESPLIKGSTNFNRVCEHVLALLKDATLLYKSGSYARAVFLAITALEETAKVVVGPYVAHPSPNTARGGALRSHPKKQAIGAGPLPLDLRPRLVKLLGASDAERILSGAWSGELVRMREKALYFEVEDGVPTLPEDSISPSLARALLVLVIDTFDDSVVGFTNESYRIGRDAEALLEDILDSSPWDCDA